MKNKRRPIMNDIAMLAGVSSATVDRVINQRPNVRPSTSRRVLRAAEEVGYLTEHELGSVARPEPLRVTILLPSGTNPYLHLLGSKTKDIAGLPSYENLRVQCFFVDSFNPETLADALKTYGARTDAIAFMAIDHPLVREAASSLRAQGKDVITIISDISSSSRIAYVGLDNRSVGRTAGHLLGRLTKRRTGQVALISGSRDYRAHEEREMGFLSLMSQSFPDISVVGVREGHDNREENYRHTLKLLSECRDLVGIYNVGGSSDGIARALREKDQDQDITFIGHGVTPDTRKLLVQGAMDVVITQSAEAMIRNVLQILMNIRDGNDISNGTLPLRMEIVVKENLP